MLLIFVSNHSTDFHLEIRNPFLKQHKISFAAAATLFQTSALNLSQDLHKKREMMVKRLIRTIFIFLLFSMLDKLK